jgi:hypothetical protein
MKLLGPTRHTRLNEAFAVVYLLFGICFTLSLVSYHPQDPSLNTVALSVRPLNLIGKVGAGVADLSLQLLGFGSFAFPVLLLSLAWKWLRSEPIQAQFIKLFGSAMLILGTCTAFSFGPVWRPFGGAITPGGVVGILLADYLISILNLTGAVLLTVACLILSLYLVSTFSMAKLAVWLAGPIALLQRIWSRFQSWRDVRRARRLEAAKLKTQLREEKLRERKAAEREERAARRARPADPVPSTPLAPEPAARH